MVDTRVRDTGPWEVAGWLMRTQYSTGDSQRLYCLRDDFYEYAEGKGWRALTSDEMTRHLWQVCGDGVLTVDNGDEQAARRMRPTRAKIADVLAALQARAAFPFQTVPRWLQVGEDLPDPQWCISFRNGSVLDVAKTTTTGSPAFIEDAGVSLFGVPALQVPWDPDAKCPTWDRVMLEWADGDPNWVECRERFYGYSLISYRGYAKWLLEYGKPRSGKGTGTNDVLSKILPPHSFVGTRTTSLTEFGGMEGVQHCNVLCLSEADATRDRPTALMVGSLMKSGLGRDPITIRGLYKKPVHNVKLRCNFILQCNDMIELPDVSGSLAGKMIPLHFRNTWIDRQDASLSDKLQRELPGILNRLVAALCRLRAEGHFSIPESSKEVLHHFEIQNNAVEVFLKETFVQDPKGFVPNELLDSERQKWELYHNVVIQDPQTGKRVHSNRLAQHIRRYASWSIGASRTSAARGLTGIRLRSTLGDPPDGVSLV